MLIKLFGTQISPEAGAWIGAISAFVVAFFLMWKPLPFLPRDGGKKVETVDGELITVNDKSAGKFTGAGVLFVPVFVLMAILFLKVDAEFLIYSGLMLVMMITGYLDDRASVPWGELVKGLLDLVISIGAVITFLAYNSSDIIIFGNVVHIPVVVYGILGVLLIFVSINVTNCSDGVDGLCGSVSIIELAAFSLIFKEIMPLYSEMGLILAAVLLAYLCFNWNPSKILMGDAGSRTIGFVLALLSMQCRHPLIFLILSLVFILDGGIGLLKMTIIRVFKVNPMKNLLTPIHDHLRKNLHMPIKAIPILYAGLQLLNSFFAWLIVS